MAGEVQVIAKNPQTKRTAWKALEAHYRRVRELHLRNLFADDPTRGERMAIQGAGIHLDYSKNRITDQTLKLLVQLAEESGLQTRIDAMFRGEKINITEKRAVLHVALRAPKGASIFVDGANVVPQVHSVLERMSHFCDRVRNGEAAIPGRPMYANRIHRDDCVGVLRHLLALERPDPLYLAADEEPAEIAEVLRWLAARLGAPQPHVDSQETGMRYGRTSNKRVRSARLRARGYRFRFPTFREGYGALIAARG